MRRLHGMLAVVALLSLGISGCASFTVEPFHPGGAWPPGRGAAGPVIGVRVHGETFLNDVEQGTSLKNLRMWREQTLRAYRESGLFAGVKAASMEIDPETGAFIDPEAGLAGVEIRADVEIVERQEANWWLMVITGVTAYIVPSKMTTDFAVKTTIRDNKGEVLGVFESSNTVVVWQQLCLVVVAPFNWSASVERETIFDLSRAALIDGAEKGVLAAKEAELPKAKAK